MGVFGSPDSCSGSTGNETCDTPAGRPQWFLLVVLSKQERRVAKGPQVRGFEVFIPVPTVRPPWRDRLKTFDAPLFPGHLFCRALAKTELMVLRIPGVVRIMPIPDLEIERLRRITASQYPVDVCAHPQTGEIVRMAEENRDWGYRRIQGVVS